MKNGLTELVFILDKSGSMQGLEADTIGGFNSLISKQKKEEGEAVISTVFFDNTTQVVHDRKNLEEVKLLSNNDYVVGGCTALIDAIGGAIHHIKTVHKYIRKEDVPEKTMFIIMTDGMENASTHYTLSKVKKSIEKQKKKHGWEFLFLGANIDAIQTAEGFGISSRTAVNFRCDSAGTQLNYDVLNDTVACYRANKSLDENWKSRIEDDYNSRG